LHTISGDAELEELSVDAGIIKLRPQVVWVAETEREVAQGLRDWGPKKYGVTPRGGGTSIPSQSVGRGAILLQARTTSTLTPDESVVCEPAIVKADLNKLLGSYGRWMPIDPSSYANCTVGGMVANNSSGVRTPKYGSTIDFVERLRVVVPGEEAEPVVPMTVEQALSGDARTRRIASLVLENQELIASEKPRVTKNSSGYRLERVIHGGTFDLPKLFVGSEGTLGVLTQVVLKTLPRPRWKLLFIVESTLDELDQIAGAFREHSPTALEIVDKSVFRTMNRWDMVARYSRSDGAYMVFCEFDGDEGDFTARAEEVAQSRAGSYDPIVLTNPSEVAAAWEVRSETLNLAQEIRKGTKRAVPGVEDLVVPPDRLGDLVRLLIDQFESRGLEYISYGHAGDANLHARPLMDISERGGREALEELMEDCFEAVWKMGGSMTGEHGDGMLRAKYVERQYPGTYWIMREVKKIFDPRGILNPGVKLA
jgi:FAD/FMN-containing dehydrogenase